MSPKTAVKVLLASLSVISVVSSRILAFENEIPQFTDVTASTGIEFVHISGGKESKDHIPEAKGGGLAVLSKN